MVKGRFDASAVSKRQRITNDLQTNEPSQCSFFRACPVLQILGGSKARILQSCLRPGDAVLESLD